MNAASRAFVDAAAGAGEVLEETGAFLLRQKAIADRRQLADGRRAMSEAVAAAGEKILGEPEPARWADLWAESEKEFDGQLRKRAVSPEVAEQLREEWDEVRHRKGLEVARDAFQKNLELARAGVRDEIESLIEAGHLDEARQMVRAEGRAAGYADADIERVERAIGRREKLEQFALDIEENPAAAAERFSSPVDGLTEADRARLEATARGELAARRRDEAARITELLEGGAIRGEEDLDEALNAATHLSPLQKEAVRGAWRDTQPLTWEERTLWADQIDDLSAACRAGQLGDEEARREAWELETELHALGRRPGAAELRKALGQVGPDKTATAPTATSRRDLIRRLAGARTQGDGEAEVAAVLREEIEDRLAAWAEAHPDAGPTAIADQLDAVQAEAAAAVIRGGAPPPPAEAEAAQLRADLGRWLDGFRPTSGGTARKVGDQLVGMVRQFEGFRPTAYSDYKQYSIGYGTRGRPGETIGREEAERRLREELGAHRANVERLAEIGGYEFSEHQLEALTSFDFNTGAADQLLILNGKRDAATIARKMLAYHNAGGKPLRGLRLRRAMEARVFLNGWGD